MILELELQHDSLAKGVINASAFCYSREHPDGIPISHETEWVGRGVHWRHLPADDSMTYRLDYFLCHLILSTGVGRMCKQT